MSDVPVFREIALDAIKPSPMNPRRDFEPTALNELAHSIVEKGVLSPILVRPVNGHFEIVYGERRWRAAGMASLERIPCIVRELDDRQALEAATVENAARQDLSALEEGDAFKKLHEDFGYSAEQIAAKVGKSKATVYARMKLAELGKEVRGAVAEGKLDASVALLIARIPSPKLQEQATRELIERMSAYADGMSYRQCWAFIQGRYMTRLSEATFDPMDATLVPAAGACGPCPKMAGNQTDLFGNVDNADVCTDTACFEKKGDAAWKRQKKEAEAKGLRVLSDKESKATFSSDWGSTPDYNSGYVHLDARVQQQAKAQGKELEVTIARAPSGEVVELVDKKAAEKLYEAERREAQKQAKAAQPRQETAAEKRDKATVAAIVAAAEKKGLTDHVWGMLFNFVDIYGDNEIALRRGLGGKPGALRKAFDKADTKVRVGILVELIVKELDLDQLEDSAKAFGVDVAKLEAELEQPAKPEPKKTPAKKAKGKKGGRS